MYEQTCYVFTVHFRITLLNVPSDYINIEDEDEVKGLLVMIDNYLSDDGIYIDMDLVGRDITISEDIVKGTMYADLRFTVDGEYN